MIVKSCIKSKNDIITSESDLTELFNNYFCKRRISELKEPILNSEFEHKNTSM